MCHRRIIYNQVPSVQSGISLPILCPHVPPSSFRRDPDGPDPGGASVETSVCRSPVGSDSLPRPVSGHRGRESVTSSSNQSGMFPTSPLGRGPMGGWVLPCPPCKTFTPPGTLRCLHTLSYRVVGTLRVWDTPGVSGVDRDLHHVTNRSLSDPRDGRPRRDQGLTCGTECQGGVPWGRT